MGEDLPSNCSLSCGGTQMMWRLPKPNNSYKPKKRILGTYHKILSFVQLTIKAHPFTDTKVNYFSHMNFFLFQP